MNPLDEAVTPDELKQLFAGEIRDHGFVDFYLDGNIDQRVAAILDAEAVHFTDVYKEGQAAEKADTRILAKSRVMGCVLVTADRDYREIHERVVRLGGLRHAGILLVKSEALKADAPQLANVLTRIAEKYEGSASILHNQLFRL